mmetsp:Transcript_23931/g.36386  ORF Transcript_23931/g.36386 Transcript_23931/m.36386 type:complete len:572 (+) Transcript_23931:35-1750(+)
MINLYLAVACLLLANVNGAHGDDEMMRNLRNGANASLPANPNRFYVLGTGGDISKEHEAEEVTASSGGSVAMTVGNGARKTLVVELPPQANAQGLRNKMEAKGFTLEVDQPLYSIPTIEGDDPGQGGRRLAQSTPWGVLNVFQNDVTPILEENLPEMQHSICIIDSGYEIVHPDLPKDAINADPGQGLGASYPYNRDGCEHGTHVAGTISAIDNDQGVIGVFPGASDMKIVRVFRDSCGWQYSSRLLDAANHCQTAGAKIITMSLGGGSPSTTERDTFDNLVDDGILVIAAAGNNGNSINYPAYYNSIVSVGATDVNDNIASWSTYNDQVDVSAPGVGIESTTGESGYSTYSGTSMATPHVSGIAMLLWNRNPTCTNLQIRHALQETAEDRGDPGRDDKYGHGIIRFHDADAWLLANCPAPGPTPAPVPTPPTPLCGTNPAATPNNDICEDGETCYNSNDCRSRTGGKPSNRFCCYGGDNRNDVTDGVSCADNRCGSQCSTSTDAVQWCCGDGTCAGGGETNSNCPEDCPAETPAPTPFPTFESTCLGRNNNCNSNSDCCSNQCKRNGRCN